VKSKIREEVEKITGVTRTWLEWQLEDGQSTKTLVVEVGFDTDPSSGSHNAGTISKIFQVFAAGKTTSVISGLRIVPKDFPVAVDFLA
jgi:hypothetical protein